MKHSVEGFLERGRRGLQRGGTRPAGVLGFGTTPEAAVHEIGDATLAWIAACRASGDPLPEPTTKARRAA